MRALDRKVLREVWRLAGQLAAVALLVACGTASFVAMRGMHGHLVSSQAAYYRQARFADLFAALKRAPASVALELRHLPGVAAVEPRLVFEVVLDVPGLAEPAVGRLLSLPGGGEPHLNVPALRSGRPLSPTRPDEVLVSEAFAEANGLTVGDAIGAVLNGRWQRLTIAGTALSPEYVYEIRSGDLFPDNRRFGVLWMGEGALAAAFDMAGAFNDVSLRLAPGASEAEVLARLDQLLAPYGTLGAYGRGEQLSHLFLSNEISETSVSALIVPAIFLAVAAFLLHLVMRRLIETQRTEIGVLKAFGYSDAAVGWHFLKLALVPIAAGGAAGAGLGLWLAFGLAVIYDRFFRFPALPWQPELGPVLGSVLIAGLGAALGALGAVRRTVRLAPATAMLPEPPTPFSRGLLERWGLKRWLGTAGRMIWRSLFHRPWRTALALTGLCLAVAISVTGRYTFDAVDAMRELTFELAAREDVTVLLRAPQSSAVLEELSRLPGVLAAEPFRAVAVRLLHGPKSDRGALLGLTADGQLHRVIGASRTPGRLPPSGLMLTTKLAEMLGAEEGDDLLVEILEPPRRLVTVPLVRRVDELVGTSAYMELGALNRLLGEGGTVSGAFLRVDPDQLERLHRTLKRLPEAAGVTVRRAALASFQKTLEQSFAITLSVLVFFAGLIAFAVVYNSARVSLSERGRDLASLRVLGFSRFEVATMLLGEQAVLTLAAVPLGNALGIGLAALMSRAYDSELFRVPFVVSPKTLGFATLVLLGAALISAVLVLLRLNRLDLVAVLKTRE